MAVDAVPASSSRRQIVGASWFRSVVRMVLALLAVWVLVFAWDRYDAWVVDRTAYFRSATGLWLSWIGATVAAGILFGLATSLPFTRVRYAWSRLLLAAIAFAPIAQFWWVFLFQLERHGEAGGWLAHADWLMYPELQFVLAALAGVAIASGFGAKAPGRTPAKDPPQAAAPEGAVR